MFNKTPTNENRSRRWTRYLLPAVLGIVILPTLLTWSAGILAKSNLGKRYPAPGQMVDVGGYKMHLYCVGQGSPTVILAEQSEHFIQLQGPQLVINVIREIVVSIGK